MSQCASAFAATASSSGVSPVRIRSSEPSSASAANSRSRVSRLASSAPSHRIAGPMRREQREVGADRERRQHHDDQKEQHADAGAAADPHRELEVAHEKGGEGAHACRSRAAIRCARSSPIGPWAAATINAAAGEVAAHQSGERVLRRAVERRGRLVEQPDRPLHRDEPRDRQPPPLAGGQIAGGQLAPRRRARPRPARRRPRAAAEIVRPEVEIFLRPSARASARPGGRDSGPVRPASVRGRRR